jgi:phosphonate transport system permease protein
MTQQLERDVSPEQERHPAAPLTRVSVGTVRWRRVVALLLVVVPVLWATERAVSGGTGLVNVNGLLLLDDLLAKALSPSLDGEFLEVVWDGAVVTVAFAAVGTLGALVIGSVGGLVLSDVAWGQQPPGWLRVLRLGLRGILVAARSIHELVWALLLVSVLGLDPLVGVLAIAIPFGAQTAKVFGETLDNVPAGPLRALRNFGARPVPAVAYALLPGATPLLLSYSFYRFECAIRSAVLLGVVGVGGLGQELVVSLQSRNWDEVWTLVYAVLLLSAVVDLWSTKLRSDMATVNCTEISVGEQGLPQSRTGQRSQWAGWSAIAGVVGVVLAWWASGVSLSGLTSERTLALTTTLLDDLWPPELPLRGWSVLIGSVADTLAMAVLAMTVAVLLTLLLGPWATKSRPVPHQVVSPGRRAFGWATWLVARLILLFLRSVPPTVWAIVALLALFPGILPGALALGLYTGGILGRLVAESWESIDIRARDALLHSGVRPSLASVAAVVPPSSHHLLTYTLYRFEICVRDTAVVGVVGAAGLGRLLAENLAAFRFPVVTTVLIASFAVSVGAELLGRWLRRVTRA